mmetsp:Transcript_8647/g.19747  ORF Transcript_8647/g.19747 Transcript_8647/m.19747 type:complete len:482 (+) Transcript_8647:57-1502(+)|eukprot:CAMPEP_0197919784 /NCGR_PEP_ID=MMETSP1439-20131203/87789_1 /TAXON_ID=66791 /ORGANISM="Gonyaulax spinifera, Strain CCMP409" /LENGTH=481 /DNA_ID=CAMNT_0043541959 /DNA_START=57 /DNA_END=1502 /DNA_ORIENTATION=+
MLTERGERQFHELTVESGTSTLAMKTFYHQSIIPLVIITVILAWFARPATKEAIPAGFRKFQAVYLSVWVFCVAADWLQGPYVYALYSAYGFERHVIAQLFVAGFASSLVCSCFVGMICDRFGRKKCALAYAVLYVVSCLTKHVKNYSVLMFGRVTGGAATSLLFSCFECWMVSEHVNRHKFSSGLLEYMFGVMYMTMYIVAIITGFVGEALADGFHFEPLAEGSILYKGGDLVPFDASIVCCVVGFVMILALWQENFGEDGIAQSAGGNMVTQLTDAITIAWKDKRLIFLCFTVACFEGSMYAFVFNWTPALQSKAVPPPYGLIFALFMMACTCGSSVATITSGWMKAGPRLMCTLLVGAAALAVAAFIGQSASPSLVATFSAFTVFEFCCGLYFPSIGVLKSEMVPERVRATMYNIYRVPLNAVVVALLLTDISYLRVFELCAVLQAVALVLVGGTMVMTRMGPKGILTDASLDAAKAA